MKYELNIYHRNTPDEELLDDLKKVADQIGMDKVTREQYDQKGKFHSGTFTNRFGTWRKALESFIEHINSNKDEIQEIEQARKTKKILIQMKPQLDIKQRELLTQTH